MNGYSLLMLLPVVLICAALRQPRGPRKPVKVLAGRRITGRAPELDEDRLRREMVGLEVQRRLRGVSHG